VTRWDKLTYRLFNFSRIPLPGSDGFSAIAPNALHTTLIVDDFYYSVDIFSPSSDGAPPKPLAAAEIENRIRAAVEDAKTRRDRGEKPDMVGILTGDERDSWTKVSFARWTLLAKLIIRIEKRSSTFRPRTEKT
jgi:carnitine O-acetyltransferase